MGKFIFFIRIIPTFVFNVILVRLFCLVSSLVELHTSTKSSEAGFMSIMDVSIVEKPKKSRWNHLFQMKNLVKMQ